MIVINLVNEIIIYIEENIGSNLSASDVAVALGFSERHLRRVFKDTTQLTLKEYVRQRKVINGICDLIINKSKKDEVANKYGYKTYDSFSNAFKKVLGLNLDDYILNNATKIIYKEVLPGLTVPTLNFNNVEERILNSKKTKDLIWNKNIITTPLYVVRVNDSGTLLIRDLKNIGLKSSNIKSHQTYISKPVSETIISIHNQVRKNDDFLPLVIITYNKNNFQTAKRIQTSLANRQIVSLLLMDTSKNDITVNDLSTLIKYISNANSKGLKYKDILKYLLIDKTLRVRITRKEVKQGFIVIKSKEKLAVSEIVDLTSNVNEVLGYEVHIDQTLEKNTRIIYLD